MLYLVISIAVFVPYVVLILYYRSAWISIREQKPETLPSLGLPSVSVLVAARNEEKNIAGCLDALVAQDYPSNLFEIIVIDDHSEDDTASIVASVAEKKPQVRLLRLSELFSATALNSFKKAAIATGIKNAKGALIVTTDADCIVPPLWMRTIGSCYAIHEPGMIAAPVQFYIPPAQNFFKKFFFIFQTLDFMTLQGITGAALQKRLHYMANGANLAYPKAMFKSVGGFEGIDRIASGDDMLLMEKIGFPKNIKYLKSKNAIVSTQPEPTLKAFIHQRIRWAGKSSAYNDKKIKWVMAVVYFVNAWILIAAAGMIFSKTLMYYFFIFLFVKMLVDLMFFFPVSRFFQQRKLLWWFILMEPLHIIYVIVAGWLGALGTYQWKGRKVK